MLVHAWLSLAPDLSAVAQQLLTVSEHLFEVRDGLLPYELSRGTRRLCLVAHVVSPQAT